MQSFFCNIAFFARLRTPTRRTQPSAISHAACVRHLILSNHHRSTHGNISSCARSVSAFGIFHRGLSDSVRSGSALYGTVFEFSHLVAGS